MGLSAFLAIFFPSRIFFLLSPVPLSIKDYQPSLNVVKYSLSLRLLT